MVKYPFTAPSEDVMLSKQTKFWSLNNYNNYFIYSSLWYLKIVLFMKYGFKHAMFFLNFYIFIINFSGKNSSTWIRKNDFE